MRTIFIFSLSALLLMACSDDETSPLDSTVKMDKGTDGGKNPDLAPPDVLPPDVRSPDVRPPDVRTPDVRPPDLTVDQLLLEAGPDTILWVPDMKIAPSNSKCAAAKTIVFSAGQSSIKDNTTNSSNEFGKAISCGSGYDYDGPQVYYTLPMTKDKGYRLVMKPTGWDGAMYAFDDKTCTGTTISNSCSGKLTDEGGTGGKETLLLAAAVTANLTIAVDSYSPTTYGAFTLDVTEFTPSAKSKCSGAATVNFGGTSKVSLKGDTSLDAVDDAGKSITCGKGSTMAGPQHFYKVSMATGSAYTVTVNPKFKAMVYVFPASYCGVPANIELACSGKLKSGTVLGPISSGSTSSLTFKPKSGEDYIIAVDSTASGKAGAYTLDVSLVTPKNDSCSAPDKLAFTSGVATATGDNSYGSNAVAMPSTGCTKSTLKGADLFYSAALTASQPYLITLYPSSTLDGAVYVSSSCSATGSTCLAGADMAPAGKPEKVLFTPKATGTYIFGVGSRYAPGATFGQGSFILGVQPHTTPSNTACSKATSLAWAAGKASTTGNTAGATNEYGAINCGGPVTFDGAQLYYKVLLTAGKKYLAKVTPAASFDPAIYAFPATTSCSSVAINSACKGMVADNLYGGAAESVVISPTTSGSWTLAVDSATKGSFGPFTITVSELTTVYNDTCASATGLAFVSGAKVIKQLGQTYGASNVVALPKTGCTKNLSLGADVFYKIKLDAQVNYKVKVDGTGFDEVVYLMSTCTGSNTCYVGSDKSVSAAEEVSITPLSTQVYYIGVDGKGAADSGPFTLTVEQTASVCSSATALNFSGGVATVTGVTTTEANSVEIPKSGCTGVATKGPDVFMSASLLKGKKYTVTLTPTAYDGVLYLFGNCKDPASSCLASSASAGSGGTETLTFSPPSTGIYYIGVDSPTTGNAGPFKLSVQ